MDDNVAAGVNPLNILRAIAGQLVTGLLAGRVTYGDIRAAVDAGLEELASEQGWNDDTVIHLGHGPRV